MRVLIADQRPSVHAAIRAVLEHDSGCEGIDEVISASDAMTALGFGADAVVLEWGLPGMPSEMLIARLRALRPGLIVVVLGRFADARQPALAAGADHYIDTTGASHDFVVLLHELCQRGHSMEPVEN